MSRLSSSVNRTLLRPLGVIFLALMAVVPTNSQTAQTAAKPDRGTGSVSSYVLSELENVNLGNGNLNISIPLASLPAMAGGKLKFTLKATYNSKLYNTYTVEARLGPGEAGALIYTKQIPRLSNEGGWIVNGRYFLTSETANDDFVRLGDTGDPDLQFINGLSKVFLVTPDGSRHELRPIDRPAWNGSNPTYLGYYTVNNNVANRYYSFDGSYLWAKINPPGSTVIFEVYQADGTKIIQTNDGIQRITDPNGNSIKIFTDTSGVTHYQDEQTSREIKYFEDSQDIGHVQFQTVNGNWVQTDITFGSTLVQGKTYDVETFCSPDQPDCQCTYQELFSEQMRVIREITLPATEPAPAARQKFTFNYNSDIVNEFTGTYKPGCFSEPQTIPFTPSYGNGQLSEMHLPSGAVAKYTYGLQGNNLPGEATNFAGETLTGKTLEHDGATDVWTYFITDTFARVTNPDESLLEQDSFIQVPGHMSTFGGGDGLGGLVYRVKRAGKELIERHWTRLKFSGGQDESPGGKTVFNPVVDFEYFSILDANGAPTKMSARAYKYDFNGNLLETKEYDWFAPNLVSRDIHGIPTAIPPSATLLRTSANTYFNSPTTSTSSDVYAKRALSATTLPMLKSLRQTTVGPSITQLAYDAQAFDVAPTLGNMTSQRVWHNVSGTWITTSQTFDSYGNVTSRTDGRGNVTELFYEDGTHALPTRIVVDPENSSGEQTTTMVYDFSTGLVKQQIDVNGNVSDIDYTNQLTSAIDPFGRPGVTTGPIVNAAGVNQRQKVTYTYFDSARQTVTATDLRAENDKLLKKRTSLDMMGREVLTEQSEDGATYTISSRKAYDLKFRATYTSGPMRSAAATTDGWTRTITDELGRITSAASFAGATQPTLTATNWIARATTTYDNERTITTDAAGKTRRVDEDPLGRIVKVIEDPSGLAYETTYGYDALGNLTSVVQGGQSRTFGYDSLSRLTSALNPESGTFQYEYDENGNQTRKIDSRLLPNSQTHVEITYGYDALNRLISRSYNDGTPAVTYTYDTGSIANSKGRVTKVSSSVSTYDYLAYDALGRVTSSKQTTDAIPYTMSYDYNLSGGLVSEVYPSGRTVSAEFDNAGRVSGVKNPMSGNYYAGGAPTDSANRIKYNPFGAVTEMHLGNNLWERATFNSLQQVTHIGLGSTASNSSVLGMDYAYGATTNNGNLQSQVIKLPNNVTFTQTYAYDQVNRLQSAVEMKGATESWKQAYLYTDANGQNGRYGNRRIDPNSANTTPALVGDNPVFSPATNRIQPQAGEQYLYDAGGNLTRSKTGVVYEYDGDNRMNIFNGGNPAAGGATYRYDGDGRRVKTITPTGTIVFVYNAMGKLIAEYSTTPPQPNGTSYLTADHLGSPRVITRGGGVVVGRHDYLPFGEEIPVSLGDRSSIAGYVPTNENLKQKFTGKERDTESGLDYFGARYYASTQGRFTGADEIWKDSQVSDPQSWNKYAYARNNPLKFLDPTGEKATVKIETDEERKRGKITVKASIALWTSKNTGLSQADLQKSAQEFKANIEQSWSGSYTQDGIKYDVSVTVDVQVYGSEKAAMDSGAQNVLRVTEAGGHSGIKEQSAYRAVAGSPDVGEIAADAGIRKSEAAHEFTHLLGVDNRYSGAYLSNTYGDQRAMKANDYDYGWAFGGAINSHRFASRPIVATGRMWETLNAGGGSRGKERSHTSTRVLGAPYYFWR